MAAVDVYIGRMIALPATEATASNTEGKLLTSKTKKNTEHANVDKLTYLPFHGATICEVGEVQENVLGIAIAHVLGTSQV